jgi:hypothetical protein
LALVQLLRLHIYLIKCRFSLIKIKSIIWMMSLGSCPIKLLRILEQLRVSRKVIARNLDLSPTYVRNLTLHWSIVSSSTTWLCFTFALMYWTNVVPHDGKEADTLLARCVNDSN